MTRSLLVIAGEVSGDMHAARVVRDIIHRDPSIRVWGIGGDQLRACGAEILYDVRDMAVMGLTEVLRRYSFFRSVFHHMLDEVQKRKPDAVMLVDYPGFNLRFAKKIHKLGIPVLYYICPQVWAWHRSRIQLMARIVDHLLVIFPFEVDVFSGTGLPVTFVGHPLAESAKEVHARPEESLPWAGQSRVAILPGSRRHEVERILPVMLEAARLLEEKHAGISFLIAAPSPEIAQLADQIHLGYDRGPKRIRVVSAMTREILRQARAALVASGTATIEAALMHCPMVIAYRTALLTYLLGRMLVRVDMIGMVNIVAGKKICPEFIQDEATGRNLANALGLLLSDTQEYRRMVSELDRVDAALSDSTGQTPASDIVLSVMKDKD